MRNIDELLKIMVDRGASDLHLKTGSPPVVRVDGELYLLDEKDITPDGMKEYAAAIMSDKQIVIFSEQNEIDFAYGVMGVGRFRVNIFRQRGSISIAMRQVVSKIPGFEELHLPPVIQRLALEPRGMILVTGTTGSGKTTTLASMIDYINQNVRRHIVTVEDPIEILHTDNKSMVNQREVGIDTRSYSSALKYVLRQDPDVIFIGEMRDLETVRTAMTAAQTGHLVLSTLHTIDVSETINRIIDFFPLHQQKQVRILLAGSLRGIVSQRLLPRADGHGRVPALELMVMTKRIRDLVLDSNQTHKIEEAIREGDYYGMQTFDQSLLSLYKEGLVTLQDAALVASNPHDFKLMAQQEGFDVSLISGVV
ncbi:MAG: PilT/PilU family type 4a pilus ATPase [Actinobacteria bacterium]|nr:PilT/PilU family type 4a pilus ATPase [Actinomycetota bacterium]